MIQHVVFNRKTGSPDIIAPWIHALNNPRIMQEKAGFLFKVGRHEDSLLLAVEPCLINGERRYHFNMHLAHEDAYTLTGSVNPQGEFTILFCPECRALTDAQCARYRDVVGCFAALILSNGYAGRGMLDDVTGPLLQAIGFDPMPSSLSNIPKRTP